MSNASINFPNYISWLCLVVEDKYFSSVRERERDRHTEREGWKTAKFSKIHMDTEKVSSFLISVTVVFHAARVLQRRPIRIESSGPHQVHGCLYLTYNKYTSVCENVCVCVREQLASWLSCPSWLCDILTCRH